MTHHYARLHKRDPKRNQYRYYSLDVQPHLFGGWSLIREWGRIGRPSQVRIDLNCHRGAHTVLETARGRRSDQGVEEPTEPRGLSRRVSPLLEGQVIYPGRRTNPLYCCMSRRLPDCETRAPCTRMHLAAAQAASHPPGFTGGLASIGAGTSGCVVPVMVQSLILLCCLTPDLIVHRHSRLPLYRP
jgi:hypothetical protein